MMTFSASRESGPDKMGLIPLEPLASAGCEDCNQSSVASKKRGHITYSGIPSYEAISSPLN